MLDGNQGLGAELQPETPVEEEKVQPARHRALPWFRLYAEFASDPKVQRMPECMQRRLVMLLCARCCDGLVTDCDADLAFAWRIGDGELAETKALFIQKGFIDEQWNVLNWDKRQFLSDSSTERTRRYRERKRTSRDGHSSAEATNSDALEQNRTDTEHKKKPPRAKREPREVDPRFTPTQEFIEKCCQHAKVDLVWDGSEAGQLSKFLKAAPGLDIDAIKNLIRNRFRSTEPAGARPREWIQRLNSYATGPLDRFNKPEESPNGALSTGTQQPTLNASQRRTANNLSEAQRALQRIDEREQTQGDRARAHAAGSGR